MLQLERKVKNKIWALRYPEKLPARALLLVTNPRSGSTLLTDALRCHPAVDLIPRATLLRNLDIVERRYPRDLTGGADASRTVETYNTLWEKIPVFESPSLGGSCPVELKKNRYALEKLHPESYLFDSHKFLAKLSELEDRGVKIQVVYCIREPISSIESFLNYQERNPTWYPDKSGKQVIDYTVDTFSSLCEVAQRRKGLIVDYSQITGDLVGVLVKIYESLWADINFEATDYQRRVAEFALSATARDSRKNSQTS